MTERTMEIDSAKGEFLGRTYHTGDHKPFSLVWKFAPDQPIEYAYAIFWKDWREAARSWTGVHAPASVASHGRSRIEVDQTGDAHQLVLSPVHFCMVVCDWIRWHPKAGAAACNSFMNNAFGSDGHANVDIALRTGLAAVHDIPEIGEHGFFKQTQLDAYIREVLHLRGERPN